MPDSPVEAHVIVDLSDTPEIVVVSSEDEATEDFEGHLEKEDDPEEDKDIDEAVVEQQWDHKIDEMIVKQQVEQEADEVESGVSDSSFNSIEELKDCILFQIALERVTF